MSAIAAAAAIGLLLWLRLRQIGRQRGRQTDRQTQSAFTKFPYGMLGFPKTISQIRVSRDQNVTNCGCDMSSCANSIWDSYKSGINIEAHSLISHQLADHVPLTLPTEANLDPFKTEVWDDMSRICKPLSQIAYPRAFA